MDNVVEANLLACTAQSSEVKGPVFNVATARRTGLYFKILKKLTGYSVEVKYGPDRAGCVKHSLADISLAELCLGYKPTVDFEEGLARTIAWYRNRELEPQMGKRVGGHDLR